MKKASAILVLSSLCVVCVVACGQKGPLYLPQSGQPAPSAAKHFLVKKQSSSAQSSATASSSSASSAN